MPARKKKRKPARKIIPTREDRIKAIQKIVFPNSPNEWDGIWGKRSQAAFDLLVRPAVVHTAQASSFADPADVEAFRRCKAQGKTDQECFRVGDNGIGYWGDDTTGASPCCALHRDHIISMWGSLANGKHKPVEVTIGGKSVVCYLKDICGVKERVDLNPGACAAFNLRPPVLVNATWKWA